jgi:flagellar FliL protein
VAEAQLKEAPAEEAAAAEGGDGGKKKPPLKLIIIIAAAAVLVLGGGGTAAFLLLKPKAEAHADAKQGAKKKPHKEEKKGGKEGKEDKSAGQVREGPDGVIFYTLPDIVVNMQTADGRPTFLKLKLTLEMPDQEAVDALQPNMPRLQDMFQSFLRELRPEDLSGSQGSYQLRMEILRRVNLVMAPAHAKAVLIEEMLIN